MTKPIFAINPNLVRSILFGAGMILIGLSMK